MRVRNTKTISTSLCALALLGALCAPARAVVDPLYVGDVDAVTGEAVTNGETSSAAQVWLSDAMYYDREKGSFVYPVGVGVHEVRASVADGMVVGGSVGVFADDGVELSVKRSGAAEPEADPGNIAVPGDYAVSVTDVGGAATIFTFTIVGASTNLSGGYEMPESFYMEHDAHLRLAVGLVTAFILPTAYYNFKHLIIYDVEGGVIRGLRKYNLLALMYSFFVLLEFIFGYLSYNVPYVMACIGVGAVTLTMMPALKRGLEEWTEAT